VNKTHFSTKPNYLGHDTISRSQPVEAQHSDPEIASLFQMILPKNEFSEVPVGNYEKNGVLIRKLCHSDVQAYEDWSVSHQIVVP
jgi:hypothetical protein